MKTKKQTTKYIILFVLILITGAFTYSNAQAPLVATCGGTNVSYTGGSDGTASVTITGGVSTVIGLGPVSTTAMPFQGVLNTAISDTCDCPPGYVAVGFEGRANVAIDQFTLRCKQLLPNITLGASLVNTCTNGFSIGGGPMGPFLAAQDEALVKITITEYSTGLPNGFHADSKSISDVYSGSDNATNITNIGGYIFPNYSNLHSETAPDGNVIVGMINYEPTSEGWVQGVQFRYAPVTDVPVTASYLWSNGETTSSISNLSPGTYTVTVTKGGSSTTCSFTVNEPAPLVATCGGTNVSCEGGADGTASVTVSGGPSTVIGLGPVSTTAMPFQGVPFTPAISDTCDCPPGYVAVGFESRAEQFIDQFTLQCKQLLPNGTLEASLVNTCTNGNSILGVPQGPYLAAQDEALVKITIVESSSPCPNCFPKGMNADSKSISEVYSGSGNATNITNIGGFVNNNNINPHPEIAPDGNVIVGMINYQPNNLDWMQGVQFRYAPVTDVPPTVSYLWSNGETTSSISNLSPGTYTVTVTKGGSSTTSSFTVNEPAPLVATCGGTNVTCNGGANGTASVTITGGPSSVIGLGPVNAIAMPFQGTSVIPAISDTCDCPPGFVAVGFEGRAGGFIDQFTLKCKQLLPNGTLEASLVNTCTNGIANGGIAVGPYLAAQDEALVKITIVKSWPGLPNGVNADSKSISEVYSGSGNATNITNIGGYVDIYSPYYNPHPETAPDGNVIVGMINYLPNNLGWVQGVQFRYAPVTEVQIPTSYMWSNGETTSSISNLSAGTYTVTVTKGNCSTACSFTVTQPNAISVDAGPNKYVYRGYPDSSCTTLQSTISGGTAPLTRKWSTAGNANLGNGSTLNVCPTASRTYYLTVTDAAGCSQTDSVRVCVFDIRCGNGNNKVRVCHGTGSPSNPFVTLCVSVAEAKLHMQNHPGEQLGACGMNKTCTLSTMRLAADSENPEYDMNLKAYPNPVSESLNISLYSEASTTYSLRIVNVTGQIILSELKQVSEGENNFHLDMSGFAPGIYTIMMQSGDNLVQTRIMKE